MNRLPAASFLVASLLIAGFTFGPQIALAADLMRGGVSLTPSGGLNSQQPEILPVDEAFRLGHYTGSDRMTVFWQILPGYYLYRDKIELIRNGEVIPLDLPEGEMRDDEVFGPVQVLEGLVEVELEKPGPGVSVSVHYQGCAAAGYCYPPQKKQISPAK